MVHITVTNQVLIAYSDTLLVAGTQNIYKFVAQFDDSWDDLTKSLVFSNGSVHSVVDYTAGQVPNTVLLDPGWLEVSAVGTIEDNGVRKTIRKARSTKIKIFEAGSYEGVPYEPVVPVTVEPLTVNANGTYAAINNHAYNPVEVNIPIPVPLTEALSVTQNGVYTPHEGYVGFESVDVQVPSMSIADYAYYGTSSPTFTNLTINRETGLLETKATYASKYLKLSATLTAAYASCGYTGSSVAYVGFATSLDVGAEVSDIQVLSAGGDFVDIRGHDGDYLIISQDATGNLNTSTYWVTLRIKEG